MRLKAAFFDAGNTILEIDYRVIAEALAAEGYRVMPEAIRQAEQLARVRLDPYLGSNSSTESSEIFRRFFAFALEGVGVSWGEGAERAMERVRALNQPLGLWCVQNPEAPPVLHALRQRGFVVGCISNSKGTVAQALDAAGLAPYLDFIVDSGVVGVEKPDPKIFQVALEQAGVKPSEAVHVGDLYSVDILGARSAGITGILLDPLFAWDGVDCLRARDLSEARALIESQLS